MAEKMNDFNGKEWLQNSFSIWRDIKKSKEERALKHPAMFPITLAEKLIKIYTKDEDNAIVLDPFVGVGSTLIAAQNLGRKGIGVDLNKEFCKISKERTKTGSEVKIYNKNSKYLTKFIDEGIDLCINSPPYWDILNQRRTADKKDSINYSDSKDDIGNIEDYQDFLSELKEVYSGVYELLKPNKRCCVIVMDIRKKDKFFPLHIDITKIMEEIGFELEEFIIWDRQHEYNNMKTLGYPWVFRVNKVHEFICVFWKRDKEKKKK
ncbi:MAG: site-specific DNA-methyltransferase [Nanoarchaeota archaeon]|nr:site-specific DNA-methyltransferase [Nanoarchaeota archaeon]